MIGSWKWNAYVGIAVLLITFFSSLAHNEWTTSLIRGFYGCVIVFAVFYVFRFLLGTVAGLKHFTKFDVSTMMDIPNDSAGNTINLSTPSDETLINGMDEFVPIQPQKLVSKEKLDPEMLAQSLREMSEK